MPINDRFRRIRGALGNAVVFAVGWPIAAFALWFVLRQAGVLPYISILDGIGIALRFGVMGFITGAAFPGIMRLAYRGKPISEISTLKFAIAGGIVTGLFVPGFMETASILSGGGVVPMKYIGLDIAWAGGLGAVMAALSLKLAQYAHRRFPDTFQDHVERMERKIRLTAGEPDIPITQRPRATEVPEAPRRGN